MWLRGQSLQSALLDRIRVLLEMPVRRSSRMKWANGSGDRPERDCHTRGGKKRRTSSNNSSNIKARGHSLPRTCGHSLPRTCGHCLARTCGHSLPRTCGDTPGLGHADATSDMWTCKHYLGHADTPVGGASATAGAGASASALGIGGCGRLGVCRRDAGRVGVCWTTLALATWWFMVWLMLLWSSSSLLPLPLPPRIPLPLPSRQT